jgi:hypothetical protein
MKGPALPEGQCACNCEAGIKYEEECNEALGSDGYEPVSEDAS